jgi:ribonuclease VapC
MILDSSAILAMHLREPGYERLFQEVGRAEIVAVGTPTLFETAMVLSSRTSQDARLRLLDSMRNMNVQFVPFTEAHVAAAIDAFLRFGKGRHPAALNFGDCMAYVVAAVSGLPLLYTGSDFAQTDIPAA